MATAVSRANSGEQRHNLPLPPPPPPSSQPAPNRANAKKQIFQSKRARSSVYLGDVALRPAVE
ncbi:hypothetical protein DFQ26_004468 [Actinomortierella ambigua]|nr:hypothetical protein DFQ26_004468 [Actinomortierella ambigua]